MSSTHHRTWQQTHVAHLIITVELDPVADGHRIDRHRELGQTTKQLIEVFDAHRVPATWAVNDPAHSAATSLLLRTSVEHELAILGDPNWLGPTAGRTRFARELARRVSQARGAGIAIHALVPRVEPIKRHIDLVVKQRIMAVAGVDTVPVSYPWPTPRALHYGVWEMPFTDRLPRRSMWIFEGGRSVLRRIRRAARDASTFHLLIDAPALEREGRSAQKSVAWLARQAGVLRDRGLVHIETLSAAAARLADLPAATPQRSILRAA